MNSTTRIFTPCIVAAGAWLALAGVAAAAPGQIAFDSCLANSAAPECGDLPGAPLGSVRAVAASPDGRSVYVASQSSDSIAHFRRSGFTGRLAYDGCLANDATQGCGDLPAAPLDGARGVAVSPDGKSVYVTSENSDSIAHFFRDAVSGQLAYDGCLANDATQGCGNLPFDPLDGASGVAVSPDGKSVYVASRASDSIAHLFRNGPQGQIAWDGCRANDASEGCINVPGTPLDLAIGVTVSPDGKSVYVASDSSNSIAHLFRDVVSGQIAWDGCLANDASEGCGDLPGAPLNGANGVAVSPDGKSVYVASINSDSIAHLFRNGPQGQIAWNGCLANTAAEGCLDLPGAPLDQANDVAVSPDGMSVYVASISSDSIAHLFRNGPQGQIAWDGCLANTAAEGCGDLPGTPLDAAAGVAVSPDAKSVYVAANLSGSIVHFRELVPGPATPPVRPPAGPPSGAGPLAFGAGTRVTLTLAAKRVPANGPVKVRVTSRNGFAVTGRLSGKTTKKVSLGKGKRSKRLTLKATSFRVGAHAHKTVKLTLSKGLRRLLRRKRRLSLRLTAKVEDRAGHTGSVKKTVKPRLKRKRRR